MEFTLQARETAALAPGCALRVRCSAGMLWITRERGGEDVVLRAGESAVLASREAHYLSALGRAARASAAFELCVEGKLNAEFRREVFAGGESRRACGPVLHALAAMLAWRLCWRKTALRN